MKVEKITFKTAGFIKPINYHPLRHFYTRHLLAF